MSTIASDNTAFDSSTIKTALDAGDYDTVISEVRTAMTADPVAAMADPVIADWLGRRYRHIFLDEASTNPDAIKHSERLFPLNLLDKRDVRQKVAERMFRHIDPAEIHAEMPPARPGTFDTTTLVFCPGLITGYMPALAFQSVFPQMKERFGIRILASDSHPVRSSAANVPDLVRAVEFGIGTDSDPDGTAITADDHPTPPTEVLLMGYSKGAPDILEFLVARPDLAPKVKGFISWAGANGGSYLANGMYEKVKDVPSADLVKSSVEWMGELASRFIPFVGFQRVDRRLGEYDIKGAIFSLTTGAREQFNSVNNALLNSLGVPTFYFTGATSVTEVAYYNASGVIELNKYDKENDMQLTQKEATPPIENAVHLAKFHANHWDLSYDTWPWYETMGSLNLNEPFTRLSAMAAILLFMSEIGLIT